jgi:tetratricopeptide (TPR) repeat protein
MLTLILAVSLHAAPPSAPAAKPAAAAEKRLTFAFIPPGGADADTRALGLVLQTRTSEVLRATGLFNELHAKQMLSMAGAEAFKPEEFGAKPEVDANVAWYLGADVFLSGQLTRTDKALSFGGSAGLRGKPVAAVKPVKMGTTLVAALNAGIADISKQVAGVAAKKVAKWPDLTVGTKNDDALLAYAKCHATVLRQPMGIENPVVLDADAVNQAVTDCKKALELDPKFSAAKVALSLAYAFQGADAEASKLLADAGEQDSALYWIARFWLVSRYQSGDAGAGVLQKAAEARPGFLLAQIYLCETLTALAQNDKALKACENAAAATPNGVFPKLRVGRAQAAAGKKDEGLKTSLDALALEPASLKSREASLQVASRYIDAGKPNEAVSILEQIALDGSARGEEILRLGYALQLKGQADQAKGYYEKAIAKAAGPAEWRTRGRAWYNLAVLQAKAKANDKAKAAYKESLGTGFKVKPVDPALTAIAAEVEKTAAKPATPPREVTLYPVSGSGELEVGPSKDAPPPEFTKLKY